MKEKKVNYTAIPDLIRHIKAMYYNNDPMLNSVENVNMLYNALCDLNEIVGMDEVKDSIVKQIKFLLVNNISNTNKFESHMLHTIVFGPPGVGKTTIGSCLANIWKSLGLVIKKKLTTEPATFFKKYIDHKHKNRHKNNNSYKINSISAIDKHHDIDNVDKHQNMDTLDKHNKTEAEEEFIEHVNECDSYYITTHKYIDKLSGMSDDIRTSIIDLIIKYNNCSATGINEFQDVFGTMMEYLSDLTEFRQKTRQLTLLNEGIKNILKPIGELKPYLVREKINSPIKIVSRPDLVGQYVGHTCDKTYNLLKNTLEEGKVLFIDEAYSIVLDDKDSFGHEALNELNRFMSEHPQLVVIFAGYKGKMEDTLFKYQPGFKRRCTWIFEIGKYTGEMLSVIFIKQLKKDNWTYDGNMSDLSKFFNDKIKHFDAFGGDTIRLALYCKLKYSELKFEYDKSDLLKDKTITFNIVKKSYKDIYCKNKEMFSEHPSITHMYI
jgi:hypothetical protein